jgi:hypothetical protein
MMHNDPDSPDSEFVDSASYGKVILAGLERPPRDVEEPRL